MTVRAVAKFLVRILGRYTALALLVRFFTERLMSRMCFTNEVVLTM